MIGRSGKLSRLRGPTRTAVVIATTLLVAVLVPFDSASAASTSVVAAAGTDTALPSTASQVTTSGDAGGPFANMKITVNQTQELLNQAISVTWTGAPPPAYSGFDDSGNILGNFLQIFQCWGDDDGTNAADPGPSPTHCEFGGLQSNPGSESTFEPGRYVLNRVIGTSGTPSYNPANGFEDSAQGLLWEPFQAVDGTTVNAQADEAAQVQPKLGPYWLNPYYEAATTNEDDVALTHVDGTGSELFTVDTGLEAPGLGCGQQSQLFPDGTKKIPKCWLVIVPRSTAVQENDSNNTQLTAGPGDPVSTSPLYPSAWKNRISIPLDFDPIGSSCVIGANETRIVGSELATPAVTSWQPTLCSTPGTTPYNYASISDDQAREQLVSGATGAPGMAVVSRPLNPSSLDPTNPVVYAPITLSGVTIGFNIERRANEKDPAEAALAGIRVQRINLTPRLAAKLLTESYPAQFTNIHLITGGAVPSGYSWILSNPSNIVGDPDFVQFNPEFQDLMSAQPDSGGLVVEEPDSDAAYTLWQWVLADPEAVAWLGGTPDPWGMKVNPYYSTNPADNPSGAFGSPIPDSFPKSDPYCYKLPASSLLIGQAPRPLCILDASPYANSMQIAAQDTRAANDAAATSLNVNALSPSLAFTANGPEFANNRFIMSVTNTATAAQYGLQTAGLSPAGDDSADRPFVVPDAQNLLVGEQQMVPGTVPDVLQPNLTSTASGAYPLTMLTYAAVTPRSLDAADRSNYANFVTYASGKGQVAGLTFGDLPLGFEPLPAALVGQATAAAALIKSGDPASSSPSRAAAAAASASGQPVSNNQVSSSDSGTSTTPVASSPAGTSSPSVPRATVALAKQSRTPALGLGLIRYTLPLMVVIGLGAAIGLGFVGGYGKVLLRSLEKFRSKAGRST